VKARLLVILALLAVAAFTAFWSQRREPPQDARISYVATAQQLGVVGYRDPVGAFSLDGTRIAFAEGRHLFESPTHGGVRQQVAAADGQIRHVAPLGSSEWIFEDTAASSRWWVAGPGASRRALFGGRSEIAADSGSPAPSVRANALRQVVASPDGRWVAGIAARAAGGTDVWRIAIDGHAASIVHGAAAVAFPAWTAAGDVGCVLTADGRPRLSVPCGASAIVLDPAVDVIGPIALSARGSSALFASANDRGFVDLWSADLSTRKARRLTSFERDTYAPSIAADGRVLFKVQSYRTSVAELDLTSGAIRQLSTLQAETPSYHPDGQRLAVTYGTWRRVIDDAKYPDIAQEIGVIPAGARATIASAPAEVVVSSDSEDQAMAWSPNGRWIVLHSHREQSDDIWLRRADGQVPDRRVSFLGRGAEVGWPRWSPDGTRVLYDGASPRTRQSALFVIGIDQENGAITAESVEVAIARFEAEITHGEWMPDNATIVGIAKEAPGQHAIVAVPAAGGQARVLHRFRSEHDFPGLAVHPDGGRIAFVAPASDGFHQIFALPSGGGVPQQLTTDRTHKTQPAWSPDGGRIAFTIWNYEVLFLMLPGQ
jgi:Tol biopolymer transport system component